MSRPKGRKWTADELALLRQLASRTPLNEIAVLLDRSVLAVRTKVAHERLSLLHELANADPCPQPAVGAHAAAADDSAPAPVPGDYVVLVDAPGSHGSPRLAIVCLSSNREPTLIRTTFSSVEEAGPRFEAQARRMAAASGARAFRCTDGSYTLLVEPLAEPDALDRP